MNNDAIIENTRRWVSEFVIGLNLCPFARRVFDDGLIRYVVTDAADEAALLEDLARELTELAESLRPGVETTLLIHPRAFLDFFDYNDFLDPAEGLLHDLGLEGIIQVASFHPQYQFGDTAPDDVENYTNRSPFPMLHLLLEESVTNVAADPDALLEIPKRNIETLRGLGRKEILAKLKALTEQ
jgi:hypothetical protein